MGRKRAPFSPRIRHPGAAFRGARAPNFLVSGCRSSGIFVLILLIPVPIPIPNQPNPTKPSPIQTKTNPTKPKPNQSQSNRTKPKQIEPNPIWSWIWNWILIWFWLGFGFAFGFGFEFGFGLSLGPDVSRGLHSLCAWARARVHLVINYYIFITYYY